MKNKVILYFSLPILALVAYVSYVGLSTPDFYKAETLNWQTQSYGQDLLDLFLAVPVLLLSSIFAARGNKAAWLIWGGTIVFLLYTFVIYCFDVHFNKLFVFYCITLGLLFYSAIYFFYSNIKYPIITEFKSSIVSKVTGIYFIVIAVLFYFLWLSEIIPSIQNNTIPTSLEEVGLPTNAVHVIDLAVFLPLLFITGVLMLKRNPFGYVLAIMALSFCILMDITIGALTVLMYKRNITSDVSVAYIMGALTFVSLILLLLNLRTNKQSQN